MALTKLSVSIPYMVSTHSHKKYCPMMLFYNHADTTAGLSLHTVDTDAPVIHPA